MNKKVALSLLSATVFASMTASAFAAPKSGVYMGGDVDRYYALTDLFKLNDAGYAKFQSDLAKTKFENLIFVDHDGKGASLKEILSSTQDFEKIKRDLKQTDFEGEYAKSNLDGTNGESYDPRKDITPEPTGELKVESVSANNLKTVVVNFNAEVGSTITKGTNVKFSVNGVAKDAADYTATLSEDKKSLVIYTASQFNQSDKVKVEFVDLQDTKGGKLSTSVEATVIDTTFPEIKSVQVLSSKSLKVTASEPIAALVPDTGFAVRSEVKVDGVSLPVEVVRNEVDNTLTLNFGQSLTVGEHKLALSGLKDYANFKIADKELAFTVSGDTVAPTIASAKALDKDTVEVTFSEPVANIGTFTINGKTFTQADVNGTKVKANASKTVYTFKDSDLVAGLASLVEITVKYKDVADVEGNKTTTETTFKFKAEDDTVKPTVTLNLKSDNSLEIFYSETISNPGTITVKDANGAVVVNQKDLKSYYNATDKKATVPAADLKLTGKDAAAYSVTIKGFKDNSIRTNEGDEYTQTLTNKDLNPPKAEKAVLSTDGKSINIYFSEPMDTASLANKENYLLGGKYLSSITGATITTAGDAKSVKLSFTEARTENALKVLGLKDAAGNIVSNFNTDIEIVKVDSINFTHEAIDSASVKAIATNKVELSLATNYAKDYTFGNVNPSSFAFYDAQSEKPNAKYVATGYTLSTDKKKLTLTLNGDLFANATSDGANGAVYLAVTNDVTTNSAGKPLTIATTNGIKVNDAIKPSLSKVEAGNTIDGNDVVEKNQFTITFSEAVKATDADALLSDVVVRDDAGSLVGTDVLNIVNESDLGNGLKSIVVELTDEEVQAGNHTFTVAIPAPRKVTDIKGNVVSESAAKSVTFAVDIVPAPAEVVLADGSQGTAGDGEITGLTSGKTYKVTVGTGDSAVVKYVKEDGTLSDTKTDAAALTGTKITGLSNGTTYKVEEFVVEPTEVVLADGSQGTAGDGEITGLTSGKKYKVTVGTGDSAVVKYVKEDGTLSDTETDAAALTGTKITGLTNGETYKVEEIS